MYIDTELKFPATRLRDIIQCRDPDVYSSDTAADAPHRLDDILKLVSVRQPTSCRELLLEVQSLQEVVATRGVSLVGALSAVLSIRGVVDVVLLVAA